MMVDPHVIATYWWQILLLAAVVIAGMIFLRHPGYARDGGRICA